MFGKKKYGPAEKAVDPKFEESRERFMVVAAGAGEVQQTLGKLRSDQFSGLSEPVVALRNFYQDKGKLPDVCTESLRAIDDAFVAYNADHQKVCTSIAAFTEKLSNVRRNIEARDAELMEYHKFKAAVAKGQVGADADERERQYRASFEAANEQVKRETEAAYAGRAEAFHESFNQLVGMFATLFGSLQSAVAPLAAAIPVTVEAAPPTPPKPAAPAVAVSQQLPPKPTTAPSAAPPVPVKPAKIAAEATKAPPVVPIKPAIATAAVAAAAALPAAVAQQPQLPLPEEVKKPTVPEPVITDDMDEETRAIVKKRYEQDKIAAEQKWFMQRKKKELEEQLKQEKSQRVVEDRRSEEEFERTVKEHEMKMRQVDDVEEQENSAKTKRFQEFSAKENDKQKAALTVKAKDHDSKDKEDDAQRLRSRQHEDDERKKRFEQWKRDEEERMRRELAARIRAHEEKEHLEFEELNRHRAEEDKAILADRYARDKILVDTLQEETTRHVADYEASMRREAKERMEAHDRERAQLRLRHEELAGKRAKDLEARSAERSKKDLAMAEALAKVARELDDLERQEQREKVRRVQDDIERVERKERERRDQDDLRRKQELEKIRKRQQELEEMERIEADKRDREDKERAELRHRLLAGDSTPTPAAVAALPKPLPQSVPEKPAEQPVAPAEPQPAPAVSSPAAVAVTAAPPAEPAPQKQLPTPPQKPAGLDTSTPPQKKLPQPGASPSTPPAASPKKAEEPPFDVTVISTEQRAQYAQHFAKADVNHDGMLNGAEAKAFFAKSGLPFEKLGKIWRLADMDGDNKLSPVEFSIAIHLVYASLRGIELPATVPATLKTSAIQPSLL